MFRKSQIRKFADSWTFRICSNLRICDLRTIYCIFAFCGFAICRPFFADFKLSQIRKYIIFFLTNISLNCWASYIGNGEWRSFLEWGIDKWLACPPVVRLGSQFNIYSLSGTTPRGNMYKVHKSDADNGEIFGKNIELSVGGRTNTPKRPNINKILNNRYVGGSDRRAQKCKY
jgi:hypothetical protein